MRMAILFLVTVATAGCISPCRMPYDYGRMLAHPTMAPEDLSNTMDRHVREVSEAAAARSF
jgi:hypothetical protein